jgi:hypothetical protein
MRNNHFFILFINRLSLAIQEQPHPQPPHSLLPSFIKALAVFTSEYTSTILTALVRFDCIKAVFKLPHFLPTALSIQHCQSVVTTK